MKLRSLFFGTLCMLMLGVSFTSCSDDDDDKVVCPVPQTEFTVATGLNLTYNGGSMLGKKVTFTMPASHTMIPIKETM